MADLYAAMIGGMTPQQDPQMLADRLRGREARSMLAQLSGDSVLMPYGKGENAKILPMARQMGADRLARDRIQNQNEQNRLQRALTKSYYKQMQDQFNRRSDQSERQYNQLSAWQKEQVARWDADRAAKEAQAAAAAAAKKTVTDAQMKVISKGNDSMMRGMQIYKDLTANPGSLSPTTDLAGSAIGAMFGAGARNYYEGSRYEPDELRTRAAMQNWIADLRKTRLGSAITKLEESAGGRWNPSADGIDAAESKRRFKVLLGSLKTELELLVNNRKLKGGGDLPKYDLESLDASPLVQGNDMTTTDQDGSVRMKPNVTLDFTGRR